jgi:hypothetical protein
VKEEEMKDRLPGNRRSGTLPYGVVIFLSAFLLFAVQLILGKYFLPWFGGTPAMWTTCMFFFQTLLLAGYSYAHGLAGLRARTQSIAHSALLLLSLVLLGWLALAWSTPLTPDATWKPQGSGHPAWHLIVLLLLSAGLPYFALSSTGPLLQSWFTRTHPGRSPYRLYALSNLGSLLALISYPFVIEPHLSLRTQARLWCWGFLAFALLCVLRAVGLARSTSDIHVPEAETAPTESGTARPGIGRHILWLSLASCASVMFLATTNQICQDVAVVPFLWVLPLSLYLLSFIICFDKSRWYSRGIFHPAFAVAVFLACLVLNNWGLKHITLQIAVYSFTLFICCMVCHGELARSKPAARHLTSFYLMVALGGATGGIFVTLIAPNLFNAFWEYQLGLWGSALLLFLVLWRDPSSWLNSSRVGLPSIAVAMALLPGVTAFASQGRSGLKNTFPVLPLLIAVYVLVRWGEKGENKARHRAVPIFCAAALIVLGGTLAFLAWTQVRGAPWSSRNFYGVLTVRELILEDETSPVYSLHHGRISHGFQFRDEAKRSIPAGYYGKTSGVGRALIGLRAAHTTPGDSASLRLGVVGLGTGTIAAYGQSGDYIRYYEINPEVLRIATDKRYFTYLKNCPARLDVVIGDARISMERELGQKQSQQFDLLALDAFSGDAIPVHLLTEEAFQIYLQELKPGGILAVHITNTYLDLRPVVAHIAARFALHYAFLHTSGDNVTTSYSDWVLLTTNEPFLNSLLSPAEVSSSRPPVSHISPWTDDYSNLFQVLKR